MSRYAEKGVIGCLILEPNCIDKVSGYLEPQMFTDDLYGIAYREYLKGYENGYEVNEVTIRTTLYETDYPNDLIDKELLDCLQDVETSVFIKSYADKVVDDYKTRKADERLSMIRLNPETYKQELGKLITDLQGLIESKENNSKSVAELVDLNKDKYFCDTAGQGINLGFRQLDDMLGLLDGGDMIVIGARPSVGKSAFVTQVAANLMKQKKRVGFYNLEMQDKQVYERLVAYTSGIELKRLKRALAFNNDEKERFDRANKELKDDYQNLIITTGAKTVSEIRAESRHMGYDLIIIDYMQLITPETSYRGNRFAEVGEISRKIKNLAMELNIPIIALSQLNRLSEKNETKEPTMSELRESGNVEQDASIIILMWNLTEDRTKKGFKVDKNRQGEVGKITMDFDGKVMKFTETGNATTDYTEWEVSEDAPFT